VLGECQTGAIGNKGEWDREKQAGHQAVDEIETQILKHGVVLETTFSLGEEMLHRNEHQGQRRQPSRQSEGIAQNLLKAQVAQDALHIGYILRQQRAERRERKQGNDRYWQGFALHDQIGFHLALHWILTVPVWPCAQEKS